MQRSVALAIGLVWFLSAVSAASARPAITADVAGKTICWQDGTVEKYAADGTYMNMLDGPGTWRIDDQGHTVWKLERYPPTFTGDERINDDGTITYTGPAPGDDHVTVTGEFCNR